MSLPATVPVLPRRAPPSNVRPAFDVARIRADFPILKQTVHGKPLIYFDNGATTQKPQVVLEAISNYYQTENANVHRGAHRLSELATESYEAARIKVQNSWAPIACARLSSRAGPPKPSTWWLIVMAAATFSPAMKSSSPGWSITRTLFPGRCSARNEALTCEWCR
jgi:hypothetical protein